MRNLERATGAEVLDRTTVILEIFHRHARTREARLQVEIARLSYLAPRLREANGGRRSRARRRRRQGRGRDRARARSPAHPRPHRRAARTSSRTIEREAETRRSARRSETADGRARRLHQRRQVVADARADAATTVYVADKLFATLDTTVRALVPETEPRDPRHRHRRLHQEAAARSGRVVPLHARRGEARPTCCCTWSTPRTPRFAISSRSRARCSREIDAADDTCRPGSCSTRSIASTTTQRAALVAANFPDAIVMSAQGSRRTSRSCTRASSRSSSRACRTRSSSCRTASSATSRCCTSAAACSRSATSPTARTCSVRAPEAVLGAIRRELGGE